MGKVIQAHNLSEWYTLLSEAKSRTGYDCDESLESYLILTLDKYLTDNSLESSILALEFLESLELAKQQARDRLRNVGDRCLMLSGLFPERAEKLNVSTEYFSHIGQEAYQTLAAHIQKQNNAELFYLLSTEFNNLSLLLHAMRQEPEKIILQ